MHRRTFLAAAGLTGLGGCSGLVESVREQPTPNASGTGTPTPSTDASNGTSESTPQQAADPAYASIVDLETANRTVALTPTRYRTPDDGEIRTQFTATATAEQPATISATLENTNDFANTFRIRWTPPFGQPTSGIPRPFDAETRREDATYRLGLVLAPTADHDLVDEPPELERGSDGHWRLAGRVDQWLPERVRLEPGETVRGEYAVVGHPDGDGDGRPTGVYEFSGADDADLRLAVWATDSPGPAQPSAFDGADVPTLDGEETTAWFHEADQSTETYLRPGRESGALPVQLTFTFVNKSRAATECGHWNLYKLVDGQWFHIGPYGHTADCRVLAPGRTKAWTLNAYPGEALPRIGAGDPGATFGHLGAGRYAVAVGYGGTTDQSAALVELQGDAVSVVPTADVTTTRSGATVTATSPRHDDGERPPTTLTLTRGADAERVLVPEQVMRRPYRGLRNTLAFMDAGVERVVLETDERVAERAVGYDRDRLAFRLHGDGAFEISKGEGGSPSSTGTDTAGR